MGRKIEIPVVVTIDTDKLAERLKQRMAIRESEVGLFNEEAMDGFIQGFIRGHIEGQCSVICHHDTTLVEQSIIDEIKALVTSGQAQ
jgi:hypothetical protein